MPQFLTLTLKIFDIDIFEILIAEKTHFHFILRGSFQNVCKIVTIESFCVMGICYILHNQNVLKFIVPSKWHNTSLIG